MKILKLTLLMIILPILLFSTQMNVVAELFTMDPGCWGADEVARDALNDFFLSHENVVPISWSMEYEQHSPYASERCDYYDINEMYPTIIFGGSSSYNGWQVTPDNFEKVYSSISEVNSPISLNLSFSDLGDNQFKLDADFIATDNITSSQNKVLFVITARAQPNNPENSDWLNKPVAVSEPIDLNIDLGQSVTLSKTMNVNTAPNTELKGIVIVQSWNSKKILQSAIVDLGNTSNSNNNDVTTAKVSNYPNPYFFNGNSRSNGITISFSSPKNSEANIEIFNVKGQKIKNLYEGKTSKGKNKFVWNCKDDNNHLVSSGVYFYKIISPQINHLGKLLIVK